MRKRLLFVLLVLLACVLAGLVLQGDDGGGPGGDAPSSEAVTEASDVAPRRQRTPTPDESGPTDTAPAPPPETPDAPAPPILRVTVRSAATDAPLPGARVEITPTRGARTVLRTDSAGIAALDPAPDRGARITAYAAAHVRGFTTLSADAVRDATSAGEPHVDVELDLQGAVVLEGRVVDRDGRPLGGVTIHLDEGGSLDGVSVASAGPLLGSTASQADGTFTLDGALADDLVTLRVTHPGFAHYQRTVRPSASGGNAPLEIRLTAGGRLTGIVRGPDHAPVEGAIVLAVTRDAAHRLRAPESAASAARAGQSRVLHGETDPEGRYHVDGLALDTPYVVVATLRGVGRSELIPDVAARSDAPTTALDITLRPLHDLAVRVVDASGEPVAGATVLCLTGRFQQVKRQPDGLFRIRGLPPGDVVCDVDADGFIKRRITHELRETAEIEVRLERGLTISGVAVNDLGEPLAGARIRCMRPLGDAYGDLPDSLADTVADAEGRFSVGGLLGGVHAVLCWAEGHGRGKLEPVEAGTQDVRVVAPRKATVTLELRLPPGAAPPAKVTHEIKRAGGGSGREQDWPGDDVLAVEVPPIPLTLVLIVSGYADASFDLELAAGEQRDLGPVQLGKGLTATGRVTDPAGVAVPGTTVTATPPWALDGRTARTDASGRFALPLLSPAVHEVRIQAEGFLTRVLARDTATTLDWNLVLSRGGLLTGTLRTSDGVGVSEGTIWLLPTDVPESECDDRTEITYPESDGRYEVRAPAGTYRVEYRPEARDAEPVLVGTVKLAEGSSETLDLTVGK